ncbi:MAG TPA: efflux RND transporter periplasmic adaptor subunit [Verrucomicrobiae bacterium]|nr:efflux RND transporter periplasmic adaptor subunit [Verrucomicrobiae bacterium]
MAADTPVPANADAIGQGQDSSSGNGASGAITQSTRPRRPTRRLAWLFAFAVGLASISLAVGLRVRANSPPPATGAAPPAETVAVAKVGREDLFNEVPIPAEFRPYLEVELHAKVSGYVDKINVDMGDRVTAGQLIATLEMPELIAEHTHAVAAEKRAEADYKDAHLVYTRLMAVEKDHPNLVAQQELDAAEAKDSTGKAALDAAQADRSRYETLLAYTKITAPFSGVITRRYADPGSLIQSGTSSDTQSKPLVRLSDNYHLRLDFPVSVAYVKDIHLGDKVDVRVESLGNKTFTGVIRRNADKIDDDTRTMITEIEVDNPELELVPGMYAQVLLKVQKRTQALSVPIEAVSFEKPPSAYVLNSQNQVEQRQIALGLETPEKCEVLEGLKEGDLVVIGARGKVRPGQTVEPKLVGPLAQQ